MFDPLMQANPWVFGGYGNAQTGLGWPQFSAVQGFAGTPYTLPSNAYVQPYLSPQTWYGNPMAVPLVNPPITQQAVHQIPQLVQSAQQIAQQAPQLIPQIPQLLQQNP